MNARPSPPELIGQSRVFLDALDHASEIAGVERPVLVVGERGVGKELFAGRIHFLSERWDGPLLKVNCAAMNEALLESELFGHEAGAFTGAAKRHLGRFERAEGGTLFLDEIASASLRVQERLLRVIEYGEYERVGGEQALTANVRVVAAANVDLRARAAIGKFRADLLDRLAFDVVAAPPLRGRRDDIPLLAAHFAQAMAAELSVSFPGYSLDASSKLLAYHWPGNVRELKNAAERAVFQWAAAGAEGLVDEITIDPFEAAFGPAHTRPHKDETPSCAANSTQTSTTDAPANLRDRLDAIEREFVVSAIARNGGSQKRAAEALSLTYDQIRGIVRKHNLAPKDLGGGD